MSSGCSIRPIAVDLFAGAGGMSLGFEQAGFDVVGAVEFDPIHCATYEFNFPFWSILCRNVVDVSGAEIRGLVDINNRDIDVVFGGPPCQGFSMIGRRSLDDERNSLMYEFVRLVLELNPKYFVMENVKGLTVGKHEGFLEGVIDRFLRNGYQVLLPYQVLNAANYGVPQYRERLFLIGCRNHLPLPSYPQVITNLPYQYYPGSNIHNKLANCVTVWEAIGDLPEVENYPELLERDWVMTDDDYEKSSSYAMKLRSFDSVFKEIDADDYAYRREYDARILTSSLRTRHTLNSVKRFCTTAQGKVDSVSHFYKLHPDSICNTLRAGTGSNRGAHTSPRPIHPFTPRCITVREAARLHSYPDWFRFHKTKWHGFRQVGNSVPPLLAKAVAQEIIRVLKVNPVKPSDKYQLGAVENLRFNMSEAANFYGVDVHTFGGRTRGLKS